MAKARGVSPATVHRIWSARGLKPHRVKTFKLSNDKRFEEKLVRCRRAVSEPAGEGGRAVHGRTRPWVNELHNELRPPVFGCGAPAATPTQLNDRGLAVLTPRALGQHDLAPAAVAAAARFHALLAGARSGCGR